MKMGQLIKYNMRKFFFSKIIRSSGGKAYPRPISKKSKLSISVEQQSEILYSLFLFYFPVKVYQNILKLRCWLYDFAPFKTFYKTNRCLELISLPQFLHHFRGKIFLMLYFINWPDFWFPLLLQVLGNMRITIIWFPISDDINLESILNFLIKLLSCMTNKVRI